MSNCVYCNTELSGLGSFCKSCGRQSICTACKESLEADAAFCTVCGTKADHPAERQPTGSLFGNIFELTEFSESNGSTASRKIKLICSDEAVSNLGDFVERRIKTPQFGQATKAAEEQQFVHPDSFDTFTDEYSAEIEKVIAPSISGASELDILHTIFKRDGDEWKLDEVYLNATGKGDYGKRLTFLFLYLNDLEGTEKTTRTALNKVLNDSTVYDSNLKSWLANEAAITKDGDFLSLNAAGRRTAKEFVGNVQAEKRSDQWSPGMSSAKKATRKSASQNKNEEKETGKKNSGKQNPNAKILVSKWKALNLGVDGHSVFASKGDLDKALLALWAIRKATRDEIKEVSSQGMTSFLFQAFEIKVHKRSLERALTYENATKMVVKIKGTTFQILPPGIKHIDETFGIEK